MSGYRVLVVDDSEANRELASYLLLRDGFELAQAHDVYSTLEQVRLFHPQLVLLDIQLPSVDGLQIVKRLRGDPETCKLLLIAFTAYAMTGDHARMLAAGCDGYLAKPIDVAVFASQVRAFFQNERPQPFHVCQKT